MQRSAQLDTEQLSEAECREVLRATRVGRLLTIDKRSPEVIAVTFALAFDEVIFSYPSDPDYPEIAQLSVTFEAHDFSPERDDDRSVYLRGVLRRVDDPWDQKGIEIVAPWVCATSLERFRYYAIPTKLMAGIRSGPSYEVTSHLRLV